MAELATVYAAGLQAGFPGPVNVLGISTGGSIALQLAADHPELVGRLVLAGTAYTLGPIGRRAQRGYVERAERGGRPSPALADVVTESAIGRRLLRGPPPCSAQRTGSTCRSAWRTSRLPRC